MIYSDDDLDAAVAAGALPAEAAAGLRGFVESRRATPAADEESFRLLTGFNDIFVGIAVIMVLAALGWLGAAYAGAFGFAFVAAASWGLAEFFTRQRRMALPSILLLIAFVGGVCATTFQVAAAGGVGDIALALSVGGAGAVAAFVHWTRFRVPITVAAGMVTLGGAGVALVAALTKSGAVAEVATLVAGLLAFALALAWDMSDPSRKTRRSDVAFWLHLAAAPAIVHPAFSLLGLTRLSLLGFAGSAHAGLNAAFAAFALYAALAVVALIVDRRALMVSALVYLLFAMNSLFEATGALTLSAALAGLIVGAGLLLLSAFWQSARRAALRLVPGRWREKLPPSRAPGAA